jgi:small subunit ribosomal protein S18
MFKKSSHRSKFRPEYPLTYVFDYKDVLTLNRFVAEGGKIVPSRISKLSAGQQRAATRQIKKARHIALLPNGMQAYDLHARPEAISTAPFDFE